MSNLNEAEDYKILSFETDAKIPESKNEIDIIKFNDNNKIVEKSKTNPYHFFKRGLDVAIASVALVVLSPVFLATSIAIKLDSKGPVIFKQKREILFSAISLIFSVDVKTLCGDFLSFILQKSEEL